MGGGAKKAEKCRKAALTGGSMTRSDTYWDQQVPIVLSSNRFHNWCKNGLKTWSATYQFRNSVCPSALLPYALCSIFVVVYVMADFAAIPNSLQIPSMSLQLSILFHLAFPHRKASILFDLHICQYMFKRIKPTPPPPGFGARGGGVGPIWGCVGGCEIWFGFGQFV